MRNIRRNVRLVLEVSRLGRARTDRIRIFYGFLRTWLGQKIGKGEIDMRVRLTANGKAIPITLTNFSDFLVLYEVFVLREYDTGGTPNVIFDVGSNVGYSALFFASKFSKAVIYAFEPDPITFKKLKKNVAAYPSIIPLNVGLGAMKESLPFYPYPGSSISSSFMPRLRDQPAINVPVRTVDDVTTEYGIPSIDLLKFDVEGHEIEVLKGINDPAMVRQYVGEVHLDLLHDGDAWLDRFFAERVVERRIISESRYIISVS